MMRILFVGCVESSYILLNELIEYGANICGVVTKRESRINSDFRDLAPLCSKNNIDFLYSEKTNNNDTIKFVKDKEPDIVYCFGWSYLLSKEFIQIPKLGVVGFHPTKLPHNKGRHPITWALVLGLKSTASTFFMIDEMADSGSIISQVDIQIDIADNATSLYNKVMHVAKLQVIQITEAFEKGSIIYMQQDASSGNTWRRRTYDDGKIDFRMSSMGIYNLVRGLTKPYVGAHFEYEGRNYKVWSAQIVYDTHHQYDNLEPGKIIGVTGPNSFLVKTGDGLIKIDECDKIELKEGDYL